MNRWLIFNFQLLSLWRAGACRNRCVEYFLRQSLRNLYTVDCGLRSKMARQILVPFACLEDERLACSAYLRRHLKYALSGYICDLNAR